MLGTEYNNWSCHAGHIVAVARVKSYGIFTDSPTDLDKLQSNEGKIFDLWKEMEKAKKEDVVIWACELDDITIFDDPIKWHGDQPQGFINVPAMDLRAIGQALGSYALFDGMKRMLSVAIDPKILATILAEKKGIEFRTRHYKSLDRTFEVSISFLFLIQI